jgi:hypothetical protein
MPYAPKREQQENGKDIPQRLLKSRNMNKYAEISFAVLDANCISADIHTMRMPAASALSIPAQVF